MPQEKLNISLEQSIIDEAIKLRREDPEKWQGYLNNFWAQVIPEDNRLFRTYREKERRLGYWDKKLREVVSEEGAKQHSELRLSQTGQEFYETIDRVISEIDTNGEIREAITRLCNVQNANERGKAQDELEEKIIPVFARLVAMGYSMEELRN